MSSSNVPNLFGVGPVFPVPDLEEAVKFYCDQLGFNFDFIMEGHGSVTRCGVGIQFTKAPADFKAADYPGWTYIFTDGIDALHDEYAKNGVKITRNLESHEHGMREFEIEDLNGFKLRFGQYLTD